MTRSEIDAIIHSLPSEEISVFLRFIESGVGQLSPDLAKGLEFQGVTTEEISVQTRMLVIDEIEMFQNPNAVRAFLELHSAPPVQNKPVKRPKLTVLAAYCRAIYQTSLHFNGITAKSRNQWVEVNDVITYIDQRLQTRRGTARDPRTILEYLTLRFVNPRGFEGTGMDYLQRLRSIAEAYAQKHHFQL